MLSKQPLLDAPSFVLSFCELKVISAANDQQDTFAYDLKRSNENSKEGNKCLLKSNDYPVLFLLS